MKRWLCCSALFLVMVIGFSARSALAYTDSGTCGENVQWALNDDGVLTISGIGPMTDFQIATAPWHAYFIRDNIQQIVIEEGVTTVGTYAFMSLWQVTDVYLPSTLTEIHDHGFVQEKGLKCIHFSEGLLTIGEEAFMDCESLTEAVLPHSLTSMGKAVFMRCLSLSKVDIRENVAAVPDNAFFGCESLTSIRIGDGVTSIGSGAFAFTLKTGLKMTVWLPDNIESGLSLNIRDYDKVYVHAGSETANRFKTVSDPFIDPDHPDYLLEFYDFHRGDNAGYELIAYRRLTDTLAFDWPEQVTVIGDRLFKECAELTEITIPDGIKQIGFEAFYGCKNLQKVMLPDSVVTIADAFTQCTALTEINLPEGLLSFSFEGCSSLSHIDVPDGITTVSGQFITGTAIREIELPEGLQRIGNNAFMKSEITSLRIPSTVTSIGRNAFNECEGLTSLYIPDSVTSMDEQCFMWCTNLKSLRLPAGLTEIPNRMVMDCRSLETILIPASVTSFGYDPFGDCPSLKTIFCYSGSAAEAYCQLHALPYLLVDGESRNVIRLPSQLQEISEEMMMGTAAQEYVIPSGTTVIRSRAFAQLQQTAIVRIPGSVSFIAENAFEGSNVLFKCPADSYAARFAREHCIPLAE